MNKGILVLKAYGSSEKPLEYNGICKQAPDRELLNIVANIPQVMSQR